MPDLSTENVLVELQTLEWIQTRADEQDQGLPVGVWPFFFKIDGSTFQLVGTGPDFGQLVGAITGQTTTGAGLLPGELVAGKPRLVPPGIGEWSTTIAPLHFQGETLPPVGGVVGVAAVVFYPDTIESDALAAGHDAFNSALEFKLNTLLPTLKPMATDDGIGIAPGPDQIKALADGVGHVVHDAIYDAMDVWDKAHRLVTGGGQWFESVFTMVSQDHFGSDPFAQLDLGGTFTFLLGAAGHLGGLSAAVTRSRPTAAQTVRVHIPQPVTAVAGFSDGTFEHVAVATDGGTVTELWWQDDGPVSQNKLGDLSGRVNALAGFHTADGVNHVIVGTSAGQVIEQWWQGSGSPGSGTLATFGHPVVALAGYQTGDGILHVIAATSDGDISELWWTSGGVTQQQLTHCDHPIVDMVAFASSDGVQHVVVAEEGNRLTEVWWQGSSAVSSGPLGDPRGSGKPASIFLDSEWRTLIGLGGYFLASEHHVICLLSDGVVREVRWALGDAAATHHDLPILSATDLLHHGGAIGSLIDAFVDRNGTPHVLIAMPGGDLRDIWTGPAATLSLGGTFLGGH